MKEHITRKRKGFTLVELLIVIVVIGILSAMMMLSSSEAVSSAKATAIISDLRNLKTAVLAYFADHADTYLTKTIKENDKFTDNEINEVLQYLNGKDVPNKAAYTIQAHKSGSNIAWFIECNLVNLVQGEERASVRKKLVGRAKSVGLLSSNYTDIFDGEKGDKSKIYMLVQ